MNRTGSIDKLQNTVETITVVHLAISDGIGGGRLSTLVNLYY